VELLMVWLFLAFVIERLVEVLVKLLPFLQEITIKQVNVEMLLSLLAALVLSFGANLDFFKLFSIDFQWPYVGCVLSAFFMAAGSNVVHDITEWVKASKEDKKKEI